MTVEAEIKPTNSYFGDIMSDVNLVCFLLGIDGGGTKTEFLLTDLNGKELKRVILGGSNPVSVGIKNTFAVLNEGVTKLCEGLNSGEISAFAGIASGKVGDNQKLLNEFLSQYGFALSDSDFVTTNWVT